MAAAPGEPDRLYVVEQAGRIRIVEGGRVEAKPFLDVTSEVVSGGEQGLLSLAFHPDYRENGLLYVDYTDLNGDTQSWSTGRSTTGPPSTRRPGALYSRSTSRTRTTTAGSWRLALMGDSGWAWETGSGGDPENRAQNLSSLLGKLLTLDVSESSPDPGIAAYGLRNPWRFSLDR